MRPIAFSVVVVAVLANFQRLLLSAICWMQQSGGSWQFFCAGDFSAIRLHSQSVGSDCVEQLMGNQYVTGGNVIVPTPIEL